ncbi:MAG TPA: hypothetical protein DCW90_06475 [Lachnospiraceae bacterium]|nr:dihydrofolate reductase [uncultured Lachnoclostridium sp.]HAU85144.1 hypothetical protein [Lachnospiraceae bacterium]
MFKLVACVDRYGALGYNNDLIFNIKEDMELFKKLTMGNVVVMGANTWHSLPERFRPLPGRDNVVLTTSGNSLDGAKAYRNIDRMIRDLESSEKEVWLIGGAHLYNTFLHDYMEYVDEIHLTEVKQAANKADTYLDLGCIVNHYDKETVYENGLFQYNIYKRK